MTTSVSGAARHEQFIAKFKEKLFDTVEGSPKLDSLISNMEDALGCGIPDGTRTDVAVAAFNYAIEITLQQAIPVFLSLLTEESMVFVKELSEILEVDWIDNHRLTKAKDLN